MVKALRIHHPFSRVLLGIPILLFFLQLPQQLLAQVDPDKATISITAERMTLRNVFSEVKKQTGFDVVFSPRVVDDKLRVTAKANNEPLKRFLYKVLNEYSLTYSFVKSSIMINPRKKEEVPEAGLSVSDTQEEELKGYVYDEKSTGPLNAVSVVIKRTGKGTQTNAEGWFRLKEYRKGDSLLFSFIGYQTTVQVIPATNGTLTIGMKVAVNELDEAIVQAYGLTSRRLATGNTVKVSGDELRKQPVMNPLLALEGKVPGLAVTPVSPYANAPVKLEIRGRNSVNKNFSNEPLYIVDGVQFTPLSTVNYSSDFRGLSTGPVQSGISFSGGQSPLFGLNMNEIESIEVLTDADATAIYGARGANGVMIITTKRAKTGKAAYAVNVQNQYSDFVRLPELSSLSRYLEIRREAFRNDGTVPTIANAPDLMYWDTTRSTDWQKMVYGPGRNLIASSSVSGGDSRARAGLSAGYSKGNGNGSFKGATEAINIGWNAELNSNDRRFSLKLNGNYIYTFSDAVQNVSSAIVFPPNAPPILNSAGKPNYDGWEIPGQPNKYPWTSLFWINESKTNGLSGSITLNYEIMRGLSFSATASTFINNNNTDMLMPILSQNPKFSPMGFSYFGISKSNNLTLKPTLRYTTMISRGSLEVFAGFDMLRQEVNAVTIQAMGYTNDHLLRSISSATFGTIATDNYTLRKSLGTVLQIKYNWRNKYQVNLAGNVDGSSQFGDDSKFGKFGSAGLSWVASEETWMQRALPSWFNFLKLFVNYGLTGSNNVEDYQYKTQWATSKEGNNKYYNYNGTAAFVPVHPVNQRYHWELTKQFSSGLSMEFLQNKLTVSVNYYRKVTEDQLVAAQTPYYTGFDRAVANMPAKLENKGIEFSVRATPISRKDMNWNISFNISRNKNKILSFPGIELSPWYGSMRIGASHEMQYLLHYMGVDPLTGLATFEDRNKDGNISLLNGLLPGDPRRDDYIEIDRTMQFQGGLSTSFSYKGFSVNIGCAFFKQWVEDPLLAAPPGPMQNVYMAPGRYENTWRKPGDQALYPKFSVANSQSGILASSDISWVNALVVRFNGVGLGYSLPQSLLRKAGVAGCTLSVNTQNLLLLTGYKGFDPQLGRNPMPRTIATNLQINF